MMMEKVLEKFYFTTCSCRNSLCGRRKMRNFVLDFDAMRRQAVKGRDDDDD